MSAFARLAITDISCFRNDAAFWRFSLNYTFKIPAKNPEDDEETMVSVKKSLIFSINITKLLL